MLLPDMSFTGIFFFQLFHFMQPTGNRTCTLLSCSHAVCGTIRNYITWQLVGTTKVSSTSVGQRPIEDGGLKTHELASSCHRGHVNICSVVNEPVLQESACGTLGWFELLCCHNFHVLVATQHGQNRTLLMSVAFPMVSTF